MTYQGPCARLYRALANLHRRREAILSRLTFGTDRMTRALATNQAKISAAYLRYAEGMECSGTNTHTCRQPARELT